jgi:DNA-binding MarR family transcriptional regulator
MARVQAQRAPVDPAAPAAVGDGLGYLLKHAYQRYQAIQQPALARLGLDGRLLAVLAVIGTEGPALQQRLSERLGIDRTTMVALIDALEQAGLVQRRRDPADRRGQRVRLTGKGERILSKGLDAVRHVEDDFLAGWSSRDQREFRRLLGEIAAPARQSP